MTDLNPCTAPEGARVSGAGGPGTSKMPNRDPRLWAVAAFPAPLRLVMTLCWLHSAQPGLLAARLWPARGFFYRSHPAPVRHQCDRSPAGDENGACTYAGQTGRNHRQHLFHRRAHHLSARHALPRDEIRGRRPVRGPAIRAGASRHPKPHSGAGDDPDGFRRSILRLRHG